MDRSIPAEGGERRPDYDGDGLVVGEERDLRRGYDVDGRDGDRANGRCGALVDAYLAESVAVTPSEILWWWIGRLEIVSYDSCDKQRGLTMVKVRTYLFSILM